MRYGNYSIQGIVRTVNNTRHNDTCGAAAGALPGTSGPPARWRDGLLGRTLDSDGGRVFEPFDQTEATFG